MAGYNNFRKKTVFPHRYSKIFYDYWWTHTALWNSLLERLKIEKDCMILITGDTGCISGDTEIKISRRKNTKTLPIREWYNRLHGDYKPKNGSIWNKEYDLYIRSFNGEDIRLHKIKDIVYSGKKKVWKLNLSNGSSIKATPNHKIMTDKGWKELKKLQKEDLVMIDTPNANKQKRKTIKLRDIELSVGKNHPYNNKKNKQIPVHRLIYEAYENKLKFREYLDILLNEPQKCKKLKYINPKEFVIHHKDENHYNNAIENLEKLKPYEHKLKHNNYSNFSQGKPLFVQWDSIIESSIEDTYDICCEEPHHNFVANNIVVHNSGKSHFTGTFAFKHAMKEDNFILGDGSKMFIPKENFIIDPDEFAYKMITKEGQVLWLDEARSVANRRNWFSAINKAVTERKNKNRKLFNIYFFCMPFEKEFDPALGSHLTMWIWVRRGVGEVYCKRSGVKGGTGLNIQNILDREEKYLKENPKKTIVNPAIHPEYCGRIAFSKLTARYERQYKELVKEKKATGDLTDEEKLKYGIEVERTPKDIIMECVEKIKKGEIKDKKSLWLALDETKLDDTKKLSQLNFYLKLEGYDTFNKLFDKSKLEQVEVDW